MTPEEAKKEFNKFVSTKTSMKPAFVDVVNDALEKQVPKQAIDRKPFAQIEIGRCPVCGGGVNNEDPYCYGCGQRILWEDE